MYVLLCLICKSSYVLRSVSVHWMYQNVRIGSFFNVQLIMHHLNSFSSCSMRNLTLASLSRLFTIKIYAFAFFTSFNSHNGLFHDFLINSRHSCKKYCLHNSTLWGIAITVDPRIILGSGRGIVWSKAVIFPSFSRETKSTIVLKKQNQSLFSLTFSTGASDAIWMLTFWGKCDFTSGFGSAGLYWPGA